MRSKSLNQCVFMLPYCKELIKYMVSLSLQMDVRKQIQQELA